MTREATTGEYEFSVLTMESVPDSIDRSKIGRMFVIPSCELDEPGTGSVGRETPTLLLLESCMGWYEDEQGSAYLGRGKAEQALAVLSGGRTGAGTR